MLDINFLEAFNKLDALNNSEPLNEGINNKTLKEVLLSLAADYIKCTPADELDLSPENWVVHHLNYDCADNSFTNISLMPRWAHIQFHARTRQLPNSARDAEFKANFEHHCIKLRDIISMLSTQIGQDPADAQLALNNDVSETLNEEWLDEAKTIYLSDSVYRIKDMINTGKDYRIVYDKIIDQYIIGDANLYIHEDLIRAAINNGYYEKLPKNKDMVHIFTSKENRDDSALSDHYGYKYIYESGINVYCYEDIWPKIPLSNLLGSYQTFECISLNRGFEKVDATNVKTKFSLFKRKTEDIDSCKDTANLV